MFWWFALAAVVWIMMLSIRAFDAFFKKNRILIVGTDFMEEVEIPEVNSVDLRGTPTHTCICGSNTWYIKAMFEDYNISTYFLDMQCSDCGNLATAPTPIDKDREEKN